MYIQNFKKLAKNDLRKKTLLVAEAGYEAVNISNAIGDRLKVVKSKNKEVLIIKGQNNIVRLKLNDFKRVFAVGIGKGSALASLELAKILGKRLTGGIALDIAELKIENCKLKIFQGTHPLPSKKNVAHTKKIINLAKKAGADDLILFFICGGGSALLCGSKNEMEAGQKLFKELTSRGADILEMNTVRKHLSEVKGGGLAKLAYPATAVSLIVSDVPGDNLMSIASGPTVYDRSTKKDAEKILRKYNLQPTTCNPQLFETVKDKKYFQKIKNVLLVSNKDAINAMAKKAKQLGLKPKIYSLKLKGEAKTIFQQLMKDVGSGEIVLAGGETTVFLKSKIKNQKSNLKVKIQKIGKGGRNQEAVLGAIAQPTTYNLQPTTNLTFIGIASDGDDNSTGAAGAIGDILTIQKARKLGLKPEEFLKNHNSFNFFQKTGDLIFAKRGSFNVADLILVLKE